MGLSSRVGGVGLRSRVSARHAPAPRGDDRLPAVLRPGLRWAGVEDPPTRGRVARRWTRAEAGSRGAEPAFMRSEVASICRWMSTAVASTSRTSPIIFVAESLWVCLVRIGIPLLEVGAAPLPVSDKNFGRSGARIGVAGARGQTPYQYEGLVDPVVPNFRKACDDTPAETAAPDPLVFQARHCRRTGTPLPETTPLRLRQG